MRKLLVDRDYNTMPVSTVPFDNSNPDDLARLPFAPYGLYMDIVQNTGSGQYNSGQFELSRRWKNGLAFDVAYTLAHSDSNAPDTGNSTIGPVQFDPYDIEKDRGPDPNVVKHRVTANATWDVPFGHGRKHGGDMPAWTDALFGGWTVSTIVQARSGQNLTPFFSSYYSTSPWNTGKPLDGLGNAFCCAWRPDQIKDPNVGGPRDAFFDQTAYAVPAPGVLGNAKKGSLKGPGTWVANFAFYKDVFRHDNFRLQFSALMDNAFNHPQFFPGYGSGFVQLASNPYAAMPSLHSADALIVGVTLALIVKRWYFKVLWLLWPAWVWFSVMATANHFWLDVVAGIGVATLAAAILNGPRILRAVRA